MNADYSLQNIEQFIGQELGVSAWHMIDQEQINQFADCTGDHQWIHVDPERAANSPLGGTIAHGFFVLSLLPRWQMDLGVIPSGIAQALNYGTDKVRFLTPVPVNGRIRGRFKLAAVDDKGNGRYLLKLENIVELENSEKPAVIADTLAMLFVG